MKMLRIVALLVLFAPGLALAQESEYGPVCDWRQENMLASGKDPATVAPADPDETYVGRYFREIEEKCAARELRQREARALISSIEAMQRENDRAAQRAEAEAARKAAANAQLQAHMQSIAARKSQEWQNQLWLWEAQRQAAAQAQYQQQLLQQQRWNQTQQQWFQRDLVRAIEGLAPPHCYWSIVKQRNVCY